MDDVLAFFLLLVALVGGFAAVAVAASIRARRSSVKRWWALPAVSVAVAAVPLAVGVAGLLVIPTF